MNARTGSLIARAALVLAFCLFLFNRLASAQSANSSCKQVKGNSVENFSGGLVTTGTITNGGILNGTTEFVYGPAFVVTPDPSVVSYTSELTITTIQGQLKTSNVYLYNFGTGQFTILARIKSDASTGSFAGATGVLYFNGKTVGSTFPSEISGEICSVNE
jgi:hypothetical protein